MLTDKSRLPKCNPGKDRKLQLLFKTIVIESELLYLMARQS